MIVVTRLDREPDGRLKAAQMTAFGPRGDARAMQTVPAFQLPISLQTNLEVGMTIKGSLEFSFHVEGNGLEDSNYNNQTSFIVDSDHTDRVHS